MAKKRFQSREQLKIAGTERPDRVPELDRLAESWRELDEQGKAAADELIEELNVRGLERYVYEDRYGQLQEITIAELTVKVRSRCRSGSS